MKEKDSFTKIILVCLLIGSIAYYSTTQNTFITGREQGANRVDDYPIYYEIKAVLASINFFLLSILCINYWKVYMDTRLEFSLGLVVFSSALLLYSLSSNPLLVHVAGFRASGLGPFAMFPDLFTCIAALTLLYLSK